MLPDRVTLILIPVTGNTDDVCTGCIFLHNNTCAISTHAPDIPCCKNDKDYIWQLSPEDKRKLTH